jgi:cyanophycin synthetase
MTLASGSGDLVMEPAKFASRPPQLKAAMHAMAISYLAKRDAWFDQMASPPSNPTYANGVQQQAGVSLLR